MRTSHTIVDRSFVSILVVALLQPAGNVLATVAQPTSAGASSATAAPDGGWPRNYTTPAGERIVLYEPQIASWDDQKLLVLKALGGAIGAGWALFLDGDTYQPLFRRGGPAGSPRRPSRPHRGPSGPAHTS